MIPKDEQPYPLSEGWQWICLGDIATLFTGNSINKEVKAQKYRGRTDGLIYIATKDIGFDNQIDYETNIRIPESDNFKIAPANTPLLCIEGGSAGRKLGFTNQAVCFVNKLCAFVSKETNPKLIYYFLQTQNFAGQFVEKKHGLIGGVTVKNLEEIKFPLPPHDEQQRIVELLDELFSKLYEVKALAQGVVDGSEFRRAAILHKAFTGELTELWRDEHGTTLDSWERRTVASVCKGLLYGTSKKSTKLGKMIVLRMGNLQCGEIDWTDLAYSDDENDIKKYRLSKGDVLFNRTNSAVLVGKTSIYRGEYPAIYAGYLIKLDYDHDILSGEYLNYVLNSPNAKEYYNRVKTDGVNQSNINARKIGEYVIPLPPLDEQKEIVRILDDLLGREQRAKDLAGKTLDRVEMMKKSILTRAFRGELKIT